MTLFVIQGGAVPRPFFVFLTKKPPKFAYIKYFLYLCSRKGSYERITNIHTGL